MQAASSAALRFDPQSGALSRRGEAIRLRPKSLAVLRHLAQRAGQVVSKDELLQAVWPDTFVSDTVLKVCVAELRRTLRACGPETARALTTVHGRGYRLSPTAGLELVPGAARGPVGRAAELAALERALDSAVGGRRQTVFLRAEAGGGKTALLEAFLESVRVRRGRSVWIGHGQCVQRYGPHEVFLPVFEALGRLCRAAEGARLVEPLRRYALAWLAQLPDLLPSAEQARAQRELGTSTPGRALRGLTEALEAFSSETPLILAFEDLHWSDAASLELLSMLAERSSYARLLLLGTLRDGQESAESEALHDLRGRLRMHGRCVELRLEPLDRPAVADYLAQRCPGRPTPDGLADFVYRRSEGQPFFMISVVEYLLQHGTLAEDERGLLLQGELDARGTGVPETVHELIDREFDALSGEARRLLAAASVAGASFDARTLADALELPLGEVESACDALARRGGFLRAGEAREWPDGGVSASYAFTHALRQLAIYARVGEGRRVELHRRIGAALEAAWGARASEIAAELAEHFERGRDASRAVHYLWEAAQRASRRAAARETLDYLRRELVLLERLPEGERQARELALQTLRGGLLMLTRGTLPEVEQAFTRALELAHATSQPGPRSLNLTGLFSFCLNAGRLRRARECARELLELAEAGTPGLTPEVGHVLLGLVRQIQGDMPDARRHLERALRGPDPHRLLGFVDLRVAALGGLAYTLAHAGDATAALRLDRAALRVARALGNPYNVAYALYIDLGVRQTLHDLQGFEARLEEELALLAEHGFGLFVERITILRGWALLRRGQAQAGLEQMLLGLQAYDAAGQRLARPHFLALLAEARADLGQRDEAVRLVQEAASVIDETGEERYRPEILTLAGRLHAVPEALPAELERAERLFARAAALARAQGAHAFALRAALPLAELLERQGRLQEACETLTDAQSALDATQFDVAPFVSPADGDDEPYELPERGAARAQLARLR